MWCLGRPYPLESCAFDNRTSALEINCVPGFDGGLPQKFTLQVKGIIELA